MHSPGWSPEGGLLPGGIAGAGDYDQPLCFVCNHLIISFQNAWFIFREHHVVSFCYFAAAHEDTVSL